MSSRVIWVLIFWLFCSSAYSNTQTNQLSLLVVQSITKQLASQVQWSNLLHYKAGIFGDAQSQTTDPAFFLSPEGNTSLEQELQTSIIKLFSNDSLNDQHPRCRFIARYYWLGEKLSVKDMDISFCKSYNEWLENIRPASVTLVFPAAYLNGPSSMFGHTLFKVDSDDYRKDIPLASYAVSYAADSSQESNEFLYAYKGLAGGFPGKLYIVPYHEKIKEYNDLENRDIWEYKLNLTTTEVLRMMQHVWELKDIVFDYYFFTQNCSYRLLTLLEIARPGLQLSSQYNFKVIPIDTVKSIRTANLVSDVAFRPSQSNLLLQRHESLSADAQTTVSKLADNTVSLKSVMSNSMGDTDKAKIYELTYDYLQFKFYDGDGLSHPSAGLSYQLLSERSKLKVGKVWPDYEMPTIRPDQSHDSSRIGFALGRDQFGNFLSFKLRPAYHESVDPASGFDFGGQINFFNMDFHYEKDSSQIKLQKFDVINIQSLTPVNQLISPMSWGIDFAVTRQDINDSSAKMAHLIGNFGKTFAASDDNRFSFLIDAQMLASKQLDKGYGLGAGSRLIYLGRIGLLSSQVQVSRTKLMVGDKSSRKQANATISYQHAKNQSIRFTWARNFWNDIGQTSVELSANWFF